MLGHTMFRIFPLLLLLLASCSKSSPLELVRNEAAHSVAVWLCDVDTNSPAVRYRAKQSLMTNVVTGGFISGQFVPVSGPAIQSGEQYGDEAVIFFSTQPSTSRVSAPLILALYNGEIPDGLSRDAVIKLVKGERVR